MTLHQSSFLLNALWCQKERIKERIKESSSIKAKKNVQRK
jgi:hypothetical protein